MAVTQLQAQICNGSLGDPIVNITFGAGPNPGAALPPGITNYQYFAADCPQDGLYTIRNATSSCHGNTWHALTDHTGNANGYFMLINASMQPSEFYLDTVRGLCGNTTYEFAAWIANVVKASACGGVGIQPDLTFRIEEVNGTVLQAYNTGAIAQTAAPQWKQYGFFFKTPPSTTQVVLRLINNSQGGCGNDLALDDITFRPCGPQITAAIQGQAATTVSVCEGTAASYSFTGNLSAGLNNPVLQWQQTVNGGGWTDIPGANAAVYTRSFPAATAAGSYAFRLAAAEVGNIGTSQCRVASLPLTVQVAANPPTQISATHPACAGTTLSMQVTAASAAWTGPAGFTATGATVTIPNAQTLHSGWYYATAINGPCLRHDSLLLQVQARPQLQLSRDSLDICEGDTAAIQVSGAMTYQWSPAAGVTAWGNQALLHPARSTVYMVSGAGANGCRDTALLLANLVRKPAAFAGPDRSLSEGETIQLAAMATGDSIRYYWSPEISITNSQSLTPLVNPVVNMQYQLHVASLLGCGIATDIMKVHVYRKLAVPNAFTPNNDGINDRWRIGGLDSYEEARVQVFDRYGREVFASRSFQGWDGQLNGRPLPTGTYYYLVRLPGNFKPVTGWVILLR